MNAKQHQATTNPYSMTTDLSSESTCRLLSYMPLTAALKFCSRVKTCIAMKFVDDVDDANYQPRRLTLILPSREKTERLLDLQTAVRPRSLCPRQYITVILAIKT